MRFIRRRRDTSVEHFAAVYCPEDEHWAELVEIAKRLGLEPDGKDEIRMVFVKRRDEIDGDCDDFEGGD